MTVIKVVSVTQLPEYVTSFSHYRGVAPRLSSPFNNRNKIELGIIDPAARSISFALN
jgi:hypothetical protein